MSWLLLRQEQLVGRLKQRVLGKVASNCIKTFNIRHWPVLQAELEWNGVEICQEFDCRYM